jgi:hypothetical protein
MDHLSACLFPWNCRYWRVVWIFAGFGPFKYALTIAGLTLSLTTLGAQSTLLSPSLTILEIAIPS